MIPTPFQMLEMLFANGVLFDTDDFFSISKIDVAKKIKVRAYQIVDLLIKELH